MSFLSLINNLATCFGLGYKTVWIQGFGNPIRIGPGSITSIATCVAYIILMDILQIPMALYLIICISVTILGFWVCNMYIQIHGDYDHSAITIDEVAGQLIALIGASSLISVLAGLAIFRILDIKKPSLIGKIDAEIPHSIGIMADDIVAGLATMVILIIL